MKKAIFAGSFDPIHDGHIKIIEKAVKMFDELFVVIADNNFKNNQTDLKERKKNVESVLKNIDVNIDILEDKYIATYAKENGIKYLVRSARNNVDFSYELDMAKINKKINDEIETVLIIPDYDDIEYSSTKFRDFKIKEGK